MHRDTELTVDIVCNGLRGLNDSVSELYLLLGD